jgi:EAL domain-containing protein (putative c-di-GMP-specific phosphodiesterase class I)
MSFVLFFIGLVFSVASVYLYDYLSKVQFLKNRFEENPYITYDLALLLSSILLVYFIYYFLVWIGLNKYKKEFVKLNDTFLNFLKDRNTTFSSADRFLLPMYETFNIFKNQFVELEKFYAEKRKELQQTKAEITEVLNMQDSLIFKVTQEGKILEANTKALKFLGYSSLAELNKKYSNLGEIFDNEMETDWIGKSIDKTIEVVIFKRIFELYLDKVPAQQEFMVSLRDITTQKENIEKLNKLAYYNAQTDLKNINTLDKQKRTVLIKIYNYDDYARVMSEEIISLFIVEFANRIKKLEFQDIYRLSNDIFALSLDEKIDLRELKASLEKSITIFIGGQKYLFNAILLLSGGVTYEKAKKTLIESNQSLMPLWDEDIQNVDIEALNMLNEAMFENRIYISYKQMTSLKTREMIFYIEPVIKEKFTGEAIFDKNVINLAKKLNFYLKMVKNGVLNNIDKLSGKKLFIDVDDSDMFYQDDFVELVRLFKKENLKVIFNISINQNYKFAYERIKILKKYGFEVSLNNIGNSYLKIKDIYSLKVDYLMIDDEIINLIQNDKRWEFIVEHIEGLVQYQNSSVISKSLNRGDFFIDDEVYLFN